MYTEPKIESSYRKNNLGKTIYDTVIKLKPLKVVEFGILHGYSTLCIAQALRDLGKGHLISYDLFSLYPYKHGKKLEIEKQLIKAGLFSYATLKQENFFEWLDRPEDFDLLHLDISNTGDIIKTAYSVLSPKIKAGAAIIFEGGTQERDQIEWMKKYHKASIYSLKDEVNYEIIDERFPGLSLIQEKQ